MCCNPSTISVFQRKGVSYFDILSIYWSEKNYFTWFKYLSKSVLSSARNNKFEPTINPKSYSGFKFSFTFGSPSLGLSCNQYTIVSARDLGSVVGVDGVLTRRSVKKLWWVLILDQSECLMVKTFSGVTDRTTALLWKSPFVYWISLPIVKR